MKQYDKIYVPDELGFYSIQVFDEDLDDFDGIGVVAKVENVIVITIEELREVFNTGYDFAKNVSGNKDFEEFLQSKGINSLTP